MGAAEWEDGAVNDDYVIHFRRKYDAKVAAEVVEAVRGGMNKCAAARKFNVSRLQVHSYCKKAGVAGPLDAKWAEAVLRNDARARREDQEWMEAMRNKDRGDGEGGSA